MKKPSVEIMERTRGTFLEFLTREDLLPLMPVFLTAHTVQGYGYLDEVMQIACNSHCRLATLSRRQEPTLPGRRYRSMSPAGRQSLQFYNEVIKW